MPHPFGEVWGRSLYCQETPEALQFALDLRSAALNRDALRFVISEGPKAHRCMECAIPTPHAIPSDSSPAIIA